MAGSRQVGGCVRCPWCPRTFWVDLADGKRAQGRALVRFGRHASTRHARSLEQAYAALRERANG